MVVAAHRRGRDARWHRPSCAALVPFGLAMLAPVVAGIFAFSLKFGGEESSVGVLLLAGFLT